LVALQLLHAAPHTSSPDAGAAELLHAPFEQLLSTYVSGDGSVDYARWKETPRDVARLEAYLSSLEGSSPDAASAPSASGATELSYWLNLYNALVIREVLRRWPLPSVQQAPQFFKLTVAVVGERHLSLDEIEKEIIRSTFKDPRIHFALNCGARSCPALRPEIFAPAKLARQLDGAARRFVNDTHNVEVKSADRTVLLSALFDWYRDDFAALATSRGERADSIGALLVYAEPPLAAALRRAREERYRIVFRDYDWELNQGGDGSGPGDEELIGKFAPDERWPLPDGGTWGPSDDRGRVVLIDFFGSYCTGCRASFPLLRQLSRANADRELRVVAVAQEPPGEALARFLLETGADFPVALDARGASQSPPWNVRTLPTQVLIDRKGVVRHRHSGISQRSHDQLLDEAKALLSESR
jgi:thiol-disulfide isomerase/thioredoxin